MSFLSVIDNWQLGRHGRFHRSTDSGFEDSPLKVPKRRKARTTILGRSCEATCSEDSFTWAAALKHRWVDGPVDDSKKSVRGAATLPAVLTKSSAATGYRRRPRLQTFDTGSATKSTGSLRTPDRFVSTRRLTMNDSAQMFRVNKHPTTLSTDERFLRNSDASPDAFDPCRRVTSPVPETGTPAVGSYAIHNRPGSSGASVLAFRRDPAAGIGNRTVSIGTIWTVGGLAPAINPVSDSRGVRLASGTNAPLYTAGFTAARPNEKEQLEKHERRIAGALELDRVSRVFDVREPSISPQKSGTVRRKTCPTRDTKSKWTGSEWAHDGPEFNAPNLRDDFYCSVLAYSSTCHTLAVGLGSLLYAWSELAGVHLLHAGNANGSWLTSLAFSSTQGTKSILAFGRSDGSLNLMSLYDGGLPRFEVQQIAPIACLKWRPLCSLRPSRGPATPGMLVNTEDLVVGDEIGTVYYYSVEWPVTWEVHRDGWSGSMTLLAKILVHSQQVCGLSFSHDGSIFATGGNDNLCLLFKTNEVLADTQNRPESEETFVGADGLRVIHTVANRRNVKEIVSGDETHRWVHGAAVKAIAFCPWQPGLVATGGGSNDKCIHFYHTTSGACLATVSVQAQVTSLIWSNTRREICATFGYAQPDHPFRIAVFSWPECKQVAAIPWEGDHRALYAIAYPGGPNESHTSREGGTCLSRTSMEGCIVVASSDESVKFHEVWMSSKKATAGGEGLLGGSDILESLEGIDKEGEIIR